MTEPQKPVLHLRYLDSVRGIAAMCVVVYHYLNWNYSDKLAVKITNFFINGADAVSFFFVLSGFVLSYKALVLKHDIDVGKFYFNRFFRLWPAFFITVLVNCLYHTRGMLNAAGLSDIFLLNKHKFWEEALMIRFSHFDYYGAGWTLVAELVMSMLVPYFIVMAMQNRRILVWFALVVLLMFTNVGGLAMFLNHFVYGVLIAAFYYDITDEKRKMKGWYKYRYLLLLLGFILLSMRPLEKLQPLGWFYDEIIYKYLGYDVFYFSGLGSLIILVLVIQSERMKKLLEVGPLVFFGKISYGIYLMHWLPCAYIFEHWQKILPYFPDEKVALGAVFVPYFILTIVLALASYHFIELPFIRWAKRRTACMKPTLVIPGGSDAK